MSKPCNIKMFKVHNGQSYNDNLTYPDFSYLSYDVAELTINSFSKLYFCVECAREEGEEFEFCFVLIFTHRSFLVYA